jgi:hypothetical protein
MPVNQPPSPTPVKAVTCKAIFHAILCLRY